MKRFLGLLFVLVAVSAAQAAAPAPKAPAPRANPVAASSAAPAPNGTASAAAAPAATPNAAAAAPNAGGAAAAGKPAAAPAEDAIGRSTPRGAVQGFLKAVAAKDFRRAALYLDLSDLPENERRGGRIYAQRLSVVLDRAAAIDPEQISDAPEGKIKDGLPPDFERVASVAARDGAHDILMQRVTEQDLRVWKFSTATVDEIQDLFDAFGHGPLVELLPAFMFKYSFLGLELWQWIGLAVWIALAAGISLLVFLLARGLLLRIAHRTSTTADDELVHAALPPFRLGAALMIFRAGMVSLGLPVVVSRYLWIGIKSSLFVTTLWLAMRLVDLGAKLFAARCSAEGRLTMASVIPLGRRTVKAVLLGVAAIVVLQNLGFQVTGLLAGLGVGGLALALAAQKTLENLFGGISLIIDQPVRVGDYCRFGDKQGVVEDVGLRSTRVRTLDRTVVSVPNAEFVQGHLENFGLRDRIRFATTLGLRYETTPDQMRCILADLRALLVDDVRVLSEGIRVRLVNFGASALEVEVACYVATTEFDSFAETREDLLLQMMDIVGRDGAGFAFPSSTVYVAQDGPKDDAARAAAEARWRARGAPPDGAADDER